MKINVGSSKLKKSFFPVSFDSSTTSNFGECVPNFCQEVVADSHVNIDMRSAVRFAPLSLPTFGRAYLHTYAFYHKFCDLWSPYNDMLAGTPYTSSNGTSYIPTKVPFISLSDIWYIILNHSTWSAWEINSSSVVNFSSSPLGVGTYSLTPVSLPISVSAVTLENALCYTLADAPFVNPLFKTYLDNPEKKTHLVSSIPTSFTSPSTSPNTFVGGDDAVYPAGADFMVRVPSTGLYTYNPDGTFSSVSGFTHDLLLTFKLNNSGKLLRKIFMGLGFQVKRGMVDLSVLPLFAFYKSYFSTFAPKRFIKYEQTFFGRVMCSIVNTGNSFADVVYSDDVFGECPLPGLIDDLLACFYTEDTDYYSSQILGLVNDYGTDLSQPYVSSEYDANRDKYVNRSSKVSSDVANGVPPSLDLSGYKDSGNDILLHTQSQQNVLARLTNFINRRSVVGGKIADLLESVFGIPKKDVFDDENPYIGSNVVDVDFSDVFSTAETPEGSLGEYAGKAIGVGSSDALSVQCSSPGYVLTFSCVVPRTQKVQGINPQLFHVSRSDFYNPDFDGLTLLPTPRLSIFAVDSPFDDSSYPVLMHSFGNQSVFAEYKMRTQGVLNGDLSLLSTKSSYDSFTLDQTMANYVAQTINDDSSVRAVITAPNTFAFAAGTMWRFIGRWLWLGNFDRIFVNTRQFYTTEYTDYTNVTWQTRDTHVTDDNLVLHNVVDLKINAPMLPNEDSYMTRDIEDLNRDGGYRSQGE